MKEHACLNEQAPSERNYRICITGNNVSAFQAFTREFLGIQSSLVEKVSVT